MSTEPTNKPPAPPASVPEPPKAPPPPAPLVSEAKAPPEEAAPKVVPPPPAPVLTVLMLTTPARDKLRAAAWASLCAQVNVPPGAVEVLVLADPGSSVDALGALKPPPWAASADIAVQAWPTLTAKLNAGFAAARGAFVAFWDDDDWSEPLRLAKTLAAIEQVPADVYGPPVMLRHELAAPTRRTLGYTSPWGLPCLNGSAIRRALVQQHPFEALHAKPTQHNLSAWFLARKKEPAFTIAPIDVTIVAMAHGGNMNVPRAFRLDPMTNKVFDGPAEYKLVGGRDTAAALLGGGLDHFEAAVR